MFGIFKNNKPEIHKMIKQAIQEEERWFNGVLADVRTKVSNNEEFDVFKYCMDVERQKSKDSFDQTDKYVDNASSREMFQTLNKICPDATYDVDNDSTSGTVKGMQIFLKRHKIFRHSFVSVSASKYHLFE
ncbi:MAG TPA: hypothetical protein EYG73_09270, partial [Arcobacter sp.]|nr:hypothetical protein [Arcobacter sp.]